MEPAELLRYERQKVRSRTWRANALWLQDLVRRAQYIEGERHAVWTDGNIIRDVSFVDTGETRVLFVPDEFAFDDAPRKVRFAFEEAEKKALVAHEKLLGAIPEEIMPGDEAWRAYPSYEDWLAGKRMANRVLKVRRGDDLQT
jgi:hypothetical protein